MAKKKEHLAWELQLLADRNSSLGLATICEDEGLEDTGLELLIDPDEPVLTLWLEVPDQPDFEGSSRAAHAWLDTNAPITGHYRLRRLVGERLADVRMVKTIHTRAVQAELDLTFTAKTEAATEQLAKTSKEIEKLADAADAGAKVVELRPPKVGQTRIHEGRLYVCVSADDDNDTYTWQDADELDKDCDLTPEQLERALQEWAKLRAGAQAGAADDQPPADVGSAGAGESPEPATGELDLGGDGDKPPADDGTIVATRAMWQAAPLRKCRSLQECCFCEQSISAGQHYYDRGFGKRAHQECIDGMAPPEQQTDDILF